MISTKNTAARPKRPRTACPAPGTSQPATSAAAVRPGDAPESARGIDLAIADLGLCTYCEETRLFSYRRSQARKEADYGRQISAIVLT